MTSKSKVSPVIFAASILCFLLPFVTISCGGERIASFSGLQLATGTSIDQPPGFGSTKKQKVDADPAAAIAALCAVVGLALSFLGAKKAIAPAICGAAGAVSLLILKSRLDGQIVKQGEGMLQLSYDTGFSLTLLLLIAGAAWNGYLIFQMKKLPATGPAPSLPLTGTGGHPEEQKPAPPVAMSTAPPGLAHCPNCGEPWTPNARFCGKCGKPMPGGDAPSA